MHLLTEQLIDHATEHETSTSALAHDDALTWGFPRRGSTHANFADALVLIYDHNETLLKWKRAAAPLHSRGRDLVRDTVRPPLHLRQKVSSACDHVFAFVAIDVNSALRFSATQVRKFPSRYERAART